MDENRIHVVAAVLHRKHTFLIAKRPAHLHQGGLWEFPGGKVGNNETALDALKREIKEEVNLNINRARPFIQIKHDYADKKILLDVWLVESFSGEATGLENQEVKWVSEDELLQHEFPAANHPIITALRLPPRCLITPDPGKQTDFFLQKLVNTLITGIDLIVLRAKSLDTHEYKNLAQKVNALCAIYDSQLLVYGDADLVEQVRADGLHLSSHDLLACKTRPISPDKWLSASCHTEYEIEHAEKIGVDFVFLSAVLETNSHSDAFLLGWNGFQRLVANAKIPVYALGGMSTEHLPLAFDAGAQGIAGISGLWIDSV